MHKAMQWWQEQQAVQLSSQAADIRDRLLQELVAIRRSLELLSADNIKTVLNHRQSHLGTLERLHQQFEHLSNSLAPPYLEESLPLAIQHLVEVWRSQYPMIKFELDIPSHWINEPLEYHRVILKTLDEFLRLSITDITKSGSLQIRLSLHGSDSRLTLQVPCAYPSALNALIASRELKYLSQAFELLTLGSYRYQKTSQRVTWYFDWQPQYNSDSGKEKYGSARRINGESESV
jgi:hypothetical protein